MTTEEKIEEQWAWLLGREDLDGEVKQLIREASRRPALRRLFPFLSLRHTLHFSGSTLEPYTWDRPFVVCTPGDGYEAHLPDDDTPPARGTLSEVLDVVVAALRPGDAATDDPPPDI
jgi:hypothetical protein